MDCKRPHKVGCRSNWLCFFETYTPTHVSIELFTFRCLLGHEFQRSGPVGRNVCGTMVNMSQVIISPDLICKIHILGLTALQCNERWSLQMHPHLTPGILDFESRHSPFHFSPNPHSELEIFFFPHFAQSFRKFAALKFSKTSSFTNHFRRLYRNYWVVKLFFLEHVEKLDLTHCLKNERSSSLSVWKSLIHRHPYTCIPFNHSFQLSLYLLIINKHSTFRSKLYEIKCGENENPWKCKI